MRDANIFHLLRNFTRRSAVPAAALALPFLLSGCLVAGYSSSGGGFIWPGGLGLVIVILLVVFLLRRR